MSKVKSVRGTLFLWLIYEFDNLKGESIAKLLSVRE